MYYLDFVKSHLDKLIDNSTDRYGREHTSMWISSIDIKTGSFYKDNQSIAHYDESINQTIISKGCPLHPGKRVYRNIDAPNGSTLYWDQPLIVAAHGLSKLINSSKYSNAADLYTKAFLERCVANNGVFLWGNHYYYDVFLDKVMCFNGNEAPIPCDFEIEEGSLHEARPITPAWESFWKISPKATERCILKLGEKHLFDKENGGFNRHADSKNGCAFLESGGILVESLCWLYSKTNDRNIVDIALCVASYSWKHRNPQINLPENNPTETRWDKFTCTTEVGLWASSLFRAYGFTGIDEFKEIAEKAASAYLKYGFDKTAGLYYGRLNVSDGSPILEEKTTLYQPGKYTDIWEYLFPTHEYPMALAQCTVVLYKNTGKALFKEAIENWARIIEKQMPARNGLGAYAEHYGRCIYFLVSVYKVLNEPKYKQLAENVAAEAIEKLYDYGMFRGHAGEDKCDAVDGVGYLLLSLMYLETGEEPDLMGFGF